MPESNPTDLVQVGGSITATDSLTGKALQAKTGTQWKFLSFADSGQRIAALLRDDAQMMIGASTDFLDQVKVGAIRVIATVADRKVPTFPELTSIKAQGIDAGAAARGVPRLRRPTGHACRCAAVLPGHVRTSW